MEPYSKSERDAAIKVFGILTVMKLEREAGVEWHSTPAAEPINLDSDHDHVRVLNQASFIRRIGNKLNAGRAPSAHTFRRWVTSGVIAAGNSSGRETTWTEHQVEATIIKLEKLDIWPTQIR